MNSQLKSIITAVTVFIAVPMTGFALDTTPEKEDGKKQEERKQEEVKEDSAVNYEIENKVNDPYQLDDQLLLLPQEPVISERTTNTYQATEESEKNITTEEDPNAAMSFNFIYYLIDKFKLADPMD